MKSKKVLVILRRHTAFYYTFIHTYYIVSSRKNISKYVVTTQVDQNGIVYDPKTDRKCRKNGTYTGIYGSFSVRIDRY